MIFGGTNVADFGSTPPTSTNVAPEKLNCEASNVTRIVINPRSGPLPDFA